MSSVLGKRQKTRCENCGLAIPIYRGRYPNNCPHCRTPFKTEDPVFDSLMSGEVDLDMLLEVLPNEEEKSLELDKILQIAASMKLIDFLVGTKLEDNSANIWIYFSEHIADSQLKDFIEAIKPIAVDVQLYPSNEEGSKWVVSIMNPRVERDPEVSGDMDPNIPVGGDIEVNQRIT